MKCFATLSTLLALHAVIPTPCLQRGLTVFSYSDQHYGWASLQKQIHVFFLFSGVDELDDNRFFDIQVRD